MCTNTSRTQERIATESPRDEQTCEVCGGFGIDVYTYGASGDVPQHDAHPSCSFNPVVDDAEDFLEALDR